ncbi:dihydrodipicolinate synthase family protein [Nocardia sp. NPDC046763]|uniref:dihydrodipicolinate synthase family protein n=1 Tax=Nocardia sp. NPDC046763 TaxID=3155256 RepID=UPI0033E299D9
MTTACSNGPDPAPEAAARREIRPPVVAVVTPFTGNRVDTDAVRRYAEWLWDRGVRTIMVNGTTGEFFATTATERLLVLAQFRRWFPGTVIAHIGACAVEEVIVQLGDVQPLADYLAVVAPYFYADPPEDGVFEYFRQILTRVEIPTLLYNFPRHTQTPVTPSILARLAEQFPLLAGIKDSGTNRETTHAYTRTGLRVLVGDDSVAAHVTDLGVDGIVTGGGNPIVEVPVGIAAAIREGDTGKAAHLQAIFDEWSRTKRSSTLPELPYVKTALGERIPNFPHETRPPLVGATPSEATDIHRCVHRTTTRTRELSKHLSQ